MKHIVVYIILCILAIPVSSRAQIGYQVSLLNTATGEPRAGVTVSAVVTITDSSDKVVYTGTQQATTNDFGVLSLAVGDDATFKNADWSKLPFFISVSVDGTLVGKSQILSVPVAEYAKKTGELTKEILVGTWKYEEVYFDETATSTIVFSNDDKYSMTDICSYLDSDNTHRTDRYEYYGEYVIDGNDIYIMYNSYGYDVPVWEHLHYFPSKGTLARLYGSNFMATYIKQ